MGKKNLENFIESIVPDEFQGKERENIIADTIDRVKQNISLYVENGKIMYNSSNESMIEPFIKAHISLKTGYKFPDLDLATTDEIEENEDYERQRIIAPTPKLTKPKVKKPKKTIEDNIQESDFTVEQLKEKLKPSKKKTKKKKQGFTDYQIKKQKSLIKYIKKEYGIDINAGDLTVIIGTDYAQSSVNAAYASGYFNLKTKKELGDEKYNSLQKYQITVNGKKGIPEPFVNSISRRMNIEKFLDDSYRRR